MTRQTFARNTIVSIFTTALDFAVLTGLVELAHVNYVIATFCGTVVGAMSNFIVNRRWSYEVSHLGAHWQLVRFLPVQAGSSGLQTFGVWAFTDLAHLEYLISKTITAVAVYLVWNYPMNRFFVFRQWKQKQT
ncbi:MAG TPA: GtrA family protein [Kofleriaceae bacterium]